MRTYVTMRKANYELGDGSKWNLIAEAKKLNKLDGAVGANIFLGKNNVAVVEFGFAKELKVEIKDFTRHEDVETLIANSGSARVVLCSDLQFKSDKAVVLIENIQYAMGDNLNNDYILEVADLIRALGPAYFYNNALNFDWYSVGGKRHNTAQLTIVGRRLYQRDDSRNSYVNCSRFSNTEPSVTLRLLTSLQLRINTRRDLEDMAGFRIKLNSDEVALMTGKDELLCARTSEDDKGPITVTTYKGLEEIISFCASRRQLTESEKKANKKLKAKIKAKKLLKKEAKKEAKKAKKKAKKLLKKEEKKDKDLFGRVISTDPADNPVVSDMSANQYIADLISNAFSLDNTLNGVTAGQWLRDIRNAKVELPMPEEKIKTASAYGLAGTSDKLFATPDFGLMTSSTRLLRDTGGVVIVSEETSEVIETTNDAAIARIMAEGEEGEAVINSAIARIEEENNTNDKGIAKILKDAKNQQKDNG